MSLRRNTAALENNQFDLLIVGGGIVGAGICYEAALRGLKVALIEQNDFASATTSACFRILHGGVRYLQHLNFRRLSQSAHEQQIIRSIAPDFTAPLPFLVPCYGHGMKGKIALTLGLSLYELIAGKRDLPSFKILSKAETLELAPALNQHGLTGGALYQDAQILSCERLTLALLKAAAKLGACVANYVRAESAENEAEKIKALRVKDSLSGKSFSISAKMFVFATGPWQMPAEVSKPRRYSRQIQLVVPELNRRGTALTAQSSQADVRAKVSRGGRAFFFVPYRGMTLIGTSEEEWSGNPSDFQITSTDAQAFLAAAAEAYPDPLLKPENIKYAWGGLIPLNDQTNAVGEEPTIDDSGANAVRVEAVKFSTFRLLSEQVLERVSRKLNLNFEKGLSIGQKIIEDLPSTLPAQIEHAVSNEMAVNLSDLILRRLPQGALGYPGEKAVEEIAAKMAQVCGWKVDQKQQQIEKLRAEYRKRALPI